MSDRVYKTARAFVKNVRIHAKRVVQGKETAGEALSQVSQDTKRLRSEVKHSRGHHDHASAARLVEKGRKAYNRKQYREAEGLFREATHEDPKYALAHTYLGNALYKLQRTGDAMHAWTKAMEVDPYSKAGQQAAMKMKSMRNKKERVITDLKDNVLTNLEKQRDRRSG